MAITRRVRSDFKTGDSRFSAVLTTSQIPSISERADYVRLIVEGGEAFSGDDLNGYAAVLATKDTIPKRWGTANTPLVTVPSTDHMRDGHIVTIEPKTGMVLTVFRPESRHNVVFATDQCNSNCLMCSQPPKDVDDRWRIQEHLRVISLIKEAPEFLCISGGEPTLLGDGLVEILEAIRDRLPGTNVQMLTNGRSYADAEVANGIAQVRHPSLISAIPLYADTAAVHDYIVQAEGAFDQTVEGLYNAAEAGLGVEIRIVLHKQSIPRLVKLAEFIYRNFPFAAHVAIMGMEHMGYVKKNWDLLWIEPVDYMSELEKAVRFLWHRGMNVSIYNLQLCLLPKNLWQFGRKSISDFKNEYVEECTGCSQREHCAGLFTSQLRDYSQHIARITAV